MALAPSPVECLSGLENMAADAALLACAERGEIAARLYTWNGPWVSLGMFQDSSRDLLPDSPAPWVMRPTGGKAVLHGHDLTVGLAMPLSRISAQTGEPIERLSRSVRTVYRLVIQPLVEGLRAAGVPAALGEDTPFARRKGPRSADCFAHVSPNDVVDARTGLKVCGCALRLTDRAVLVQASLPCGVPLVEPRLVFREPSAYSVQAWDQSAFAEAFWQAIA